MLWAHSKVYSKGGENALHSHDIEDHVFLVLQGEASFFFGDEVRPMSALTKASRFHGALDTAFRQRNPPATW